MSAVLRPSLAVRRYRARVVVRHHHDEAGADHHQEGEQIAGPLGFHYPPADRHYFGLQAGRGHADCPVAHRSISFPPRRNNTSVERESRTALETGAIAFSPPRSPPKYLWKKRRPRR